MKCKLRMLGLILALLASASANLLAQTSARDELNLGIQAFKKSKFEQAISHFEKCVALDPENSTARLYLATTYSQQYIPGVETPDNSRMAEQAIDQYQQVLDSDPASPGLGDSAKGIAYLYLQMKKFDEARKYYRLATGLSPDDPELYYSIGVVDWTLCYSSRAEERAKLGMQPDDSLPATNKKICAEIKEKNIANIQEGIDSLSKALQLRPDYDDAMAYMNLMYRERADVQCDDPAANSADLKTADDWVDKTMATKKARAKKAESGNNPSANPQ